MSVESEGVTTSELRCRVSIVLMAVYIVVALSIADKIPDPYRVNPALPWTLLFVA